MKSIDSSATAKPVTDDNTDDPNHSASSPYTNGYVRTGDEVDHAREYAQEDLQAENMATIQELKDRLRKIETTNEEYQKQLEVLQVRLDEAISGQTKLEDLANEREESLKTKNKTIKDMERKIQKIEAQYETERAQMTANQEENIKKEEELHLKIQRLKDNISQKGLRSSSHSSSPKIRSRPRESPFSFAFISFSC